jgi:hypothetical protein
MPRKDGHTTEDRSRARKRAAAHSTAKTRLALHHVDEYRAILREELDKRGLVDHPVVLDQPAEATS